MYTHMHIYSCTHESVCICIRIRAGGTRLVLRRICQYQRSAFIDYHVYCGKCDPLTSDARISVAFSLNATIFNYDGRAEPVQR